MKNSFYWFGSVVYLWVVGVAIGAIVACGIFVAPVIFKAHSFLPSLDVTQYDLGILMAQVFLRLNVFLNFAGIVIVVYEILALFAKAHLLSLIINAVNAVLIFLFTLYYTPKIIQAQGASATATPEFASLHTQSEWVFKILLISLSIGFVYRVFCVSKTAKGWQ
ncbi:hypothetical protein BBW65_07560 [Helicobacter enhydrae]|uniref:TMEM205-like domain-containing protein n=1 Tax=Helicobacter enhydrae TaxID=222136 RepID=A0A1B1U7I9_9HELI|nr:DUF4149 domain-containing protein [Helicobacter enhydrae]ANV98662.1 hypothetical protein BBW65_07560 [Helicobacter enhydrae]